MVTVWATIPSLALSMPPLSGSIASIMVSLFSYKLSPTIVIERSMDDTPAGIVVSAALKV